MSVNIGNLVAGLHLDTRQFYAGLIGAQNAMTSASGSLKAIGRGLSVAVTLPLLAAGGAAINAATNFETAFARMHGLAGVAGGEIDGLKNSVLALSEEMGRPPQELAEALYFIRSSGFAGAESLDVLTTSAMAARAGLGTTKVVSDLLTTALNAYGHANLSAADAANSLVAAVRLGKGEPDQLAAHLGYVIPIAAEMGVEFNEVAAAIAAMTRKMSATDVSTAVVNLRQVLSDLLSPAQHSRKALQEWGTSASEIRKVIRERGLLEALQFVNRQMGDNEEAFSDLFGNVRSLTGALSLAGVSSEGVAGVFADMRDNTNELSRAVEIASQTTQDKLNRSLASLKIAGIELGNALLPIFIDLVETVRQGAKWFTSLSDEGQKAVIMTAAFAAALGPAMVIMGSLVSILTAILSPLGAVVIGVGILAASFIYLYENWEAVKERISDWTWWRNMLLSMAQLLIKSNPFVIMVQMGIKALNFLVEKVNQFFNAFIAGHNKLSKLTGGLIPAIDLVANIELINPFELAVEGLEQLKEETKTYEHEFKGFTESMVGFAKKAGNAILALFPSGGGGKQEGVPDLPGTQGGTGGQPFIPKEKGSLTIIDSDSDDQTYKTEQLTGSVFRLRDAYQELADTLMNSVAEGFEQIGKGELAAGAIGLAMLASLANFGIQLGKQMVMIAIAWDRFKELIVANPGAAIAAGVALIVGMSLLKGYISKKLERGGGVQGLATGGSVTQGGVFQLHRDEMVALPRGAAITPAHMAAGMGQGGGVLTTKLSLRKLIIELDRERQRMGR